MTDAEHPLSVGNIIGAFFLVALPFWVASNRHQIASTGA